MISAKDVVCSCLPMKRDVHRELTFSEEHEQTESFPPLSKLQRKLASTSPESSAPKETNISNINTNEKVFAFMTALMNNT